MVPLPSSPSSPDSDTSPDPETSAVGPALCALHVSYQLRPRNLRGVLLGHRGSTVPRRNALLSGNNRIPVEVTQVPVPS